MQDQRWALSTLHTPNEKELQDQILQESMCMQCPEHANSWWQKLTTGNQQEVVSEIASSFWADGKFLELDSGDGYRALHILQSHFKQFKMAKSCEFHMKINKNVIEYFQKNKILNYIYYLKAVRYYKIHACETKIKIIYSHAISI